MVRVRYDTPEGGVIEDDLGGRVECVCGGPPEKLGSGPLALKGG